MANRLSGKTCLLTGVGSGIGQRTAELFCSEGAKVVGCDVNEAAAEATADSITAIGGDIRLAPAGDLTDPKACFELVAFAEALYGGIDVLFNNAARTYFAFMDEMTPELWRANMTGELDIAFHMCLAVWPALKRRGGGSIINLGSLAGHRATHAVGNVAHMAAKAAVIAMTKQMALEGGKHRIRVNTISPGPIATAATAFLLDTEEYRRIAGDFLVLGRVGKPDDIANYGLFLATDESQWITGTDLLVDGGHAVL
jgi:NAD(P)-dependent dehydrogenase (short-subunit alcohol dehydrogenase family)